MSITTTTDRGLERLEIQATPPEGALFSAYNVYFRRLGKPDWIYLASGTGERISVEGFPTEGRFEIGVAPVVNGIEAEVEGWTITPYTPDTTDFTAPLEVANFRAGQDRNQILLAWDPSASDQIDHYEIRHAGTDWDSAIVLDRVRAPLTTYMTGVRWTGTQTFRVKAVTKQGLKSSASTDVSIDVESDSYSPVQATVDEHAGGFASTKTGTEVSGGNLQITAVPATHAAATGVTHANATWLHYLHHYGSGTYTSAWVDNGAVVRERIEVDLTAAWQVTSWTHAAAGVMKRDPSILPGGRGLGDRITRDGYDADGVNITVEIDTAQDATPTPDGWRRWVPGTVYKFRQYRIRITLASITHRNVRLTSCKHRNRRLNRKDEKSVTVSGTGGTTVTWDTPFTAAPKVAATVITNTDLRVVVDTITTTGCKVYVYNTAGVEQSSATVHVLALGV